MGPSHAACGVLGVSTPGSVDARQTAFLQQTNISSSDKAKPSKAKAPTAPQEVIPLNSEELGTF